MLINLNENFYKLFSVPLPLFSKHLEEPLLLYYDYLKLCIIDKKNVRQEVPRLLDDSVIEYIHTTPISFYQYNSDIVLYPFLEFKSIEQLKNDFDDNPNNFRQLLYFQNNNYKKSSVICKLHRIDDYNFTIDYYINKKIIGDILRNVRNSKVHLLEKIIEMKKTTEVYDNIGTSLTDILNIIPNTVGTFNEGDVRRQGTFNEGDVRWQGTVGTDGSCNFSNLLNNDIKLYNYQINDILWMKNIKNDVDNFDNNIQYNYLPYYFIDINDLLGDQGGNRLIYYKYNIRKHEPMLFQENALTKSIRYYGGNLISQMGLGKSIIMLCYLFENPNIEFNQFIKNDSNDSNDDNVNIKVCNYFYKRGKNKGSHCVKKINKANNELYCTEHIKTPFIEKMRMNYNNLEFFNIKDYVYKQADNNKLSIYFKTNANIIICPSQLSDQWIREYYSKFKVKKRVLLIATYDQYQNLTFGDILFADLIVVSYNFLLNKNYQDTVFKNTKHFDNFDENDFDTIEKKMELLQSNSYNVLSRFKYLNKVLDEFHEIINMAKYRELEREIECLKSFYHWNISGTPFANGIKGFLHGLSYICDPNTFEYPTWNLNIQDFLEYGINDNLINSSAKLFRRNTKESIENEYKGNIIREKIIKLIFTEQERNIYDGYLKGNPEKNYNFLIKLCCDPEINLETQSLIKNCKTLSEIQDVLLEHNKSKMNDYLIRINDLEHTIDYLTKELNKITCENINHLTDTEKDQIDDYKLSISNKRRSLTIEKKNYDDVKRIYDYLKNVVDNLKVAETCPICLDDTNYENTAVTKCGHKFCWDCINEFIENCQSTKCPKCNVSINKSDIYLLKNESEVKEKTDDTDDLDLIINETKSTKIGNVVYYMKTQLQKDDKCIVFSQWDHVLNKVGEYLKKYTSNNIIYCKGSVFQRKKSISQFNLPNDKKGSSNIIMLSSKNAASGINLTVANKIVLLEPVYGTKEFRDDIESQAIGRADRIGQKKPIDVIRFIVKDTIEEEIYSGKELDDIVDIVDIVDTVEDGGGIGVLTL
jgi:SNF2 family DNA or RNA helicase